jgi:hypothetical protein
LEGTLVSSRKKLTPGKARTGQDVRDGRRAAIAVGLIQQKPVATIAREMGISREWTSKEAHSPETRALVRLWMAPHHHAIQRMIPRALATIHAGLKPSNKMADRLQAVKALGTVMEWAEHRTPDADDVKPLRWSGELVELLAMYRRIAPTAQAAG